MRAIAYGFVYKFCIDSSFYGFFWKKYFFYSLIRLVYYLISTKSSLLSANEGEISAKSSLISTNEGEISINEGEISSVMSLFSAS
jgi:hypothetical protein